MEHVFLQDGRRRSARVVAPEYGGGNGPSPVAVLVLHGPYQTGAKVRAACGRCFERCGGGAPPVVAYPDAYRGLWNDGRAGTRSTARTGGVDDVAFLERVCGRLRDGGARYVAVVGYSHGGHMAVRLAHEAPSALDGLVLIGTGTGQPAPGAFRAFLAADRCRPLPVVTVHGTADPVAPYEGGVTSLSGFRPRGHTLSARATAASYARRDGITAPPGVRRLPGRAGSGRTRVTVTWYEQGGRHSVALYTVHGGGHVIPHATRPARRLPGRTTRDIDAGDLVARLAAALVGGPSGPG
ncbi:MULTISPECIES: alpha/beta hydrolase family esterase [unclassified Streptomyces]|uniref:alpha/beta hydrolase family esterase n=1 Tax=unclassified Streptomyces TaxID=2593676 RepID=UPI00381C62D6